MKPLHIRMKREQTKEPRTPQWDEHDKAHRALEAHDENRKHSARVSGRAFLSGRMDTILDARKKLVDRVRKTTPKTQVGKPHHHHPWEI